MVAFEVRAAAGTFCLGGVGARCWCVVAIGLWASWVVYLALVAIKYSASNSGSAGRAQENTGIVPGPCSRERRELRELRELWILRELRELREL